MFSAGVGCGWLKLFLVFVSMDGLKGCAWGLGRNGECRWVVQEIFAWTGAGNCCWVLLGILAWSGAGVVLGIVVGSCW